MGIFPVLFAIVVKILLDIAMNSLRALCNSKNTKFIIFLNMKQIDGPVASNENNLKTSPKGKSKINLSSDRRKRENLL
jgi:hypothetical protein